MALIKIYTRPGKVSIHLKGEFVPRNINTILHKFPRDPRRSINPGQPTDYIGHLGNQYTTPRKDTSPHEARS